MKLKLLTTLLVCIALVCIIGCNNPALDETSVELINEKDSAVCEAEYMEVESPFIAENKATSPRRIVLIVWEGSSDGNISGMVQSVYNAHPGWWSSIRGYFVSGTSSESYVKGLIEDVVADYASDGYSIYNLCLWVVGKSLGAAKSYKLMYNNFDDNMSDYFNKFWRVSWAMVDAHEPVVPGDAGRSNYWYDYVNFANIGSGTYNKYRLRMYARFASAVKWDFLKICNTYQRSYYPRGYGIDIDYNGVVYVASSFKQTGVDHSSIVTSAKTWNLLEFSMRIMVENK